MHGTLMKKRSKQPGKQGAIMIQHRGIRPLFDLHGLGDENFEELCCSVWSAESGIEPPDLYGRRRQKQFGIDVYAQRRGSTEIEGISCKCYKAIKKGQIESFAQEFLDHWDT